MISDRSQGLLVESALVGAVLTLCGITIVVIPQSALRTSIVLLTLLLLPGYALTTLVFPALAPPGNDGLLDSKSYSPALSGYERIALSFGLSVAVLPLFAISLIVILGEIQAVSGFFFVATFVVVVFSGGLVRRWSLPSRELYTLPTALNLRGVRDVSTTSSVEIAVNIALVVMILVAMTSFAYAITTPSDESRYTEMALLTQGEDGSLVSGDYPRDLSRDEQAELAFRVTNHEQTSVTYTVVVQLQRVQSEPDASSAEATKVSVVVPIDRYQKTVANNESWTVQHSVQPKLIGDRLRLTYLLYKGEPPERPTVENSYRYTSLWVSVE